MARTLSGKCTGEAGKIEMADFQQFILDKRYEFNQRLNAAMENLKKIDPDWEAWFDSCPQQTCGEMLPLIEERVETLLTLHWLDLLEDKPVADLCIRFGTSL